jgi:hypothetical protein
VKLGSHDRRGIGGCIPQPAVAADANESAAAPRPDVDHAVDEGPAVVDSSASRAAVELPSSTASASLRGWFLQVLWYDSIGDL